MRTRSTHDIHQTPQRKRSRAGSMKRRRAKFVPYIRPRTFGRPNGGRANSFSSNGVSLNSQGSVGSFSSCGDVTGGANPAVVSTYDGPVFQSLEARKLLYGLTIVTHGFTTGDVPNLDPWVINMADQISTRIKGETGLPNDQIPEGTITVTDNNGSLQVDKSTLDIQLPQWQSGEMVLKLDWTAVAALFETSTTKVAEVVTNKLLDPSFFPELGAIGSSILDFPIHLIGHSRGGSLMNAMAEDLGNAGVWVDQLTFLDPHPLKPGFPEFGSDYGGVTGLEATENIGFADEYRQTLWYPTGDKVNGAYDRILNKNINDPSFFKSRGYGDGIQFDHSDTHLWYHGTIDAIGDWDDGNIHMANRKRSVWFDDGEGGGTTAGYYYSRVGGGDRASTAGPGKSNNMIRDGLHAVLGGSRSEQKTINWSSNTNWSNLLSVGVDSGYTQQIGRKISFNYKYSDWDSGTTVRIRLDNDMNPYNGFDQEVGSSIDATRTFDESNHVRDGVIKWNTSGQKADTVFVFAQITDDAGHTRYLYAPDQLQLTKANQHKGFDLSTALPNIFDGLIANNIYKIADSSSRSIFDINLNNRTSPQTIIIHDWLEADFNGVKGKQVKLKPWHMIDMGNHDQDSHRNQPMILTDHFITTTFDPIV